MTVRFPVAVVIRPKVAELILVTGFPHCGLFKMLIRSARRVMFHPSRMVNTLATAPFRPSCPGPLAHAKFSGVFPVLPGEGFWKTVFPLLSTTTWFENTPARLVLPPKFGSGASLFVRLGKYDTKPFPLST